MASDVEFALMSASAYRTTREEVNQVAWPESLGWMPLKDNDFPGIGTRLASLGFTGAAWHVTAGNGFEAVAYQKGAEVVIAIAGWAPPSSFAGDVLASIGLGAGLYVGQLRDAARYYVALKEALPAGTQFTFTGHSLGGGLAALLGVYFDQPAVAFDQAPFKPAALADHKARIASDLASVRLGPDADLAGYFVGEETESGRLVRGEQNVRSLSVEGDILSGLFPASSRLGQHEQPIDLDDAVVSATGGSNLHSINLLALLHAAPDFANRTTAIPGLLPSLFEKRYFARDFRLRELDHGGGWQADHLGRRVRAVSFSNSRPCRWHYPRTERTP
jgi:hypothetical protein